MTLGGSVGVSDIDDLRQEHRALLMAYGSVQRRCNALLDAQASQIQSLTSQVMRLHGALVVRDTARAWSIASKNWHKDTVPAVLCVGTQGVHAAVAQRVVEMAGGQFLHHEDHGDANGHDEEKLEASLVAADLVICQTGCLSHNAYWRVQDHCRRTGKQCVMVSPEGEQTQVLRLYRSLPSGPTDTPAAAEPSV